MTKKVYYSSKYLFQKIFSREVFVASVDFVLYKEKVENFHFRIDQFFGEKPVSVFSPILLSTAGFSVSNFTEFPLPNVETSKSYTKELFIAFYDFFYRIVNYVNYPIVYTQGMLGTTKDIFIKTNLILSKWNNLTDLVKINSHLPSEVVIFLRKHGSMLGVSASLWGVIQSITHLVDLSYEVTAFPKKLLLKKIFTYLGGACHLLGMVVFFKASSLSLNDHRLVHFVIFGSLLNYAGAYGVAINLYLDGHQKPLQIKLFVTLLDSLFFVLQNWLVSCEFARVPLSVLKRIILRDFGLKTLSQITLDSAQQTIQKLNGISDGLIDTRSSLIDVSLLTYASGKRLLVLSPNSENLLSGDSNFIIPLLLKEK